MQKLRTHTPDNSGLLYYPYRSARRRMPFLLWGIRCIVLYSWVFPNTCIGIPFIFLALISRGHFRWVNGVLEISSPLIDKFLHHCIPVAGGASAMTLGHIIIGRNPECLDSARIHEQVHVRQFEKWGPLFIPAYFTASFIAYCKGKDPYLGNVFEKDAYEKEARERMEKEYVSEVVKF